MPADAGAEATISKESYGIRRSALETHSERRNHTTAVAADQPAGKSPFCSVTRTVVLWCVGGVFAYVGSQRP
ncbi:ATP synthase subunit B [Synechococcus sp. BL107]|nr:ATP synthase subunit B [Synechococcus sp. BL107]